MDERWRSWLRPCTPKAGGRGFDDHLENLVDRGIKSQWRRDFTLPGPGTHPAFCAVGHFTLPGPGTHPAFCAIGTATFLGLKMP